MYVQIETRSSSEFLDFWIFDTVFYLVLEVN